MEEEQVKEIKQIYVLLAAFEQGFIDEGPDRDDVILKRMEQESNRIFGTGLYSCTPDTLKGIFKLAHMEGLIGTREGKWGMTGDGVVWQSIMLKKYVPAI